MSGPVVRCARIGSQRQNPRGTGHLFGNLAIRVGLLLSAFFHRIAFLDPVRGEIVRQKQGAQIRKAHVAKRVERWANVRAVFERAAAAIDDEIRGTRNALRPLLQIGESLLGLRGAVKHGARHVRAHVERAEANADNDPASPFLSIRQVLWSIWKAESSARRTRDPIQRDLTERLIERPQLLEALRNIPSPHLSQRRTLQCTGTLRVAILSRLASLGFPRKKRTAGLFSPPFEIHAIRSEVSKNERNYVVGCAVIFFCLMAFTLSPSSSGIFRSFSRAPAVVSISAF